MLYTAVMKDNKDFQRCYRKGRYAACGFLTVYYYPNGLSVNRLGLTVSKKLGGAVERNRVKRIFRAAYRLNETLIPIGYDLVFVGRNDAAQRKSTDVERFIRDRLSPEMERAGRNGLFDKPRGNRT